MVNVRDDYLEKVIKQGDRGSQFLAERTAGTLKNSPHVSIEGKPYSLVGLRIPKDYSIIVHSSVGDNDFGLERKAESLVENLLAQAFEVGAFPVGFANIIDSRTGDDSIIHALGYRLERISNERMIVMLNGENAILGNRVIGDANISGTMISVAYPKQLNNLGIPAQGIYHGKNGNIYCIFPSTGEFIFINSDGVGTKHEFYERMGLGVGWAKANKDWLAMTLDDAVKNNGRVIAASGIYEHSKNATGVVSGVPSDINGLCKSMGIMGTLQSFSGNIQSYKEGVGAFNIGGSVVSSIDDERLNNLPVPKEGDWLVAVRGKPNPRSNGITAKREAMVKLFGEEWNKTEWGRIFLQYLGEPSTILYPAFKHLLDKGLASSVFHMSGGAFNGKLARPLAKQGLYVNFWETDTICGLYVPDWRESALASISSADVRASYAKFPMGNDGFFSTSSPEEAVQAVQREGLEARVAGNIEKRTDGKTGVRLIGINGEEISFSGKD